MDKMPVYLKPQWLAETTKELFDKLDQNGVLDISQRYNQLIGKCDVITVESWLNVLARYLVKLIDQALAAVPETAKSQEYWPAIEKSTFDCKRLILTYNRDATDKAACEAFNACADANAIYGTTGSFEAYISAFAPDAARAAVLSYDAAYGAIHVMFAYSYYSARAADYATQAAAYCIASNDGNSNFDSAIAAKLLFNALLDEIEHEISIQGDSSTEGQNQ